MDHHSISHIDANMTDTGGIVGACEEHQIAGLHIGRGYAGTDVAKSLCAQSAYIPAGMIDDPTDKARTVKRSGRAAAAPK